MTCRASWYGRSRVIARGIAAHPGELGRRGQRAGSGHTAAQAVPLARCPGTWSAVHARGGEAPEDRAGVGVGGVRAGRGRSTACADPVGRRGAGRHAADRAREHEPQLGPDRDDPVPDFRSAARRRSRWIPTVWRSRRGRTHRQVRHRDGLEHANRVRPEARPPGPPRAVPVPRRTERVVQRGRGLRPLPSHNPCRSAGHERHGRRGPQVDDAPAGSPGAGARRGRPEATPERDGREAAVDPERRSAGADRRGDCGESLRTRGRLAV